MSAPHQDAPPREAVRVDDVSLASLHTKERHEIQTRDGWTLVITRYKPRVQDFPQPIFGQPIVLVHGFGQNRRAWTSGEFVRNMLYFGADLHLLELRGHGKSSISLQRRRARQAGTKPPPDLKFDWDIDSYFLFDLPAAIGYIRNLTGHDRIFYCGHSMGGILGYGYAGMHPRQLEGLIAIGAPSDPGQGFLALRLLAHLHGVIPVVDGALSIANGVRRAWWEASRLGSKLIGARAPSRPRNLRWRYIPVDSILRGLERVLTSDGYQRMTRIAPGLSILVNPERASLDDVRWLLREGADREPRKVMLQFARWIRHNELKCYRTGYDFKRGFGKIEIPTAIIFGDRDWLADMKATRSIYYGAKSDYLLWRPVKGNSHVELTMGHDIRQIAYDIKNLIEYAVTHRAREPSLPRRD